MHQRRFFQSGGREVLATGLDGMLDVDLAALAELAGEYQRDFQAATMETWLSRVQETAPLHERLLGSLSQSLGNSQRAVTTPAMTRVHARARRATVPSAKVPLERCVTSPEAMALVPCSMPSFRPKRQVKSTLPISTSTQSNDAIITERAPTAEKQTTHLDSQITR